MDRYKKAIETQKKNGKFDNHIKALHKGLEQYLKKVRIKQKIEIIKCACGCGKEFNKYDKRNRVRLYYHGHNSTKKIS